MNKKTLKVFAVNIAIPLLVGGLATLFTYKNMNLMNEIVTPSFAPPAWLFPVVWTLLYVLMGVSISLVILGKPYYNTNDYECAVRYYIASLVLNFFWNIIFFNFRAFMFAFVWLILLLVTIVLTIFYYLKLRKVAAYLQIPYFLWVTFAGILTFSIALLNG